MESQEQTNEEELKFSTKRKKIVPIIIGIFIVALLIIIPSVLQKIQHTQPAHITSIDSSNQLPQFASKLPIIKVINVDTKKLVEQNETNFEMDYDILPDYANGHYLADLEQPGIGTAFNADMLVYDGKQIIDSNIRDFILSKNGEHFAFTTIDEMTTGYPVEAITLYVDGNIYLLNQPNLKLIGISNDGKQIFYTTQPNNTSGKGNFYVSKKIIHVFSGKNYDDAQILSDFNINSTGEFYSYNIEGKTYVNGSLFKNTAKVTTIFSDNYQHILYLVPNSYYVGEDEKLYIDNKFQFEGNMEYVEPNTVGAFVETNPEIDNSGQFALVDSDRKGGGTVFLQNKPYKLKSSADQIYFNQAQNHLLIHYMNGNWQLDGKPIHMPNLSLNSAIELDNNDLYIYNFTK